MIENVRRVLAVVYVSVRVDRLDRNRIFWRVVGIRSERNKETRRISVVRRGKENCLRDVMVRVLTVESSTLLTSAAQLIF